MVMTLMFNTVGSGHTLNKATLKALVMSFPTCLPHLKIAAEDAKVAKCLREKWGVFPFDTKMMKAEKDICIYNLIGI
jgi:hypothetical protein